MASTNWSDYPRFMRTSDVCGMLGITDNTLRVMVNDGEFPRPVRISRQMKKYDKYKVLLYCKGWEVEQIENLTEKELEDAIKQMGI